MNKPFVLYCLFVLAVLFLTVVVQVLGVSEKDEWFAIIVGGILIGWADNNGGHTERFFSND